MTHRRLVIASSPRSGDDAVPIPRAGDGYVTWGTNDHRRGIALHVRRMSDGHAWVVARHQVITDSGIAAGRLVFDTAGSAHPNVVSVPLTGGPLRRVSSTGSVPDPRVGAGHAIWIGPPGGNPQQIYVSDLKLTPRPVLLLDGESQGNAVIGTDFAAYWDASGAVMASSLRAHATPLRLSADEFVPARMAAGPHDLVYATTASQTGRGIITIHLVSFA